MIIRDPDEELIASAQAILPQLTNRNESGFVRNTIECYHKNHKLSDCQARVLQAILQEQQ